jgi:hypothetical protein
VFQRYQTKRAPRTHSAATGQGIERETNEEAESQGESQCGSEPGGSHYASWWYADDWQKRRGTYNVRGNPWAANGQAPKRDTGSCGVLHGEGYRVVVGKSTRGCGLSTGARCTRSRAEASSAALCEFPPAPHRGGGGEIRRRKGDPRSAINNRDEKGGVNDRGVVYWVTRVVRTALVPSPRHQRS